MKKQYIIGIDGGSQSTKIAIYDLQGSIVSKSVEPLRPTHLAPQGVVEHSDDDLWDTLCAASTRAMAALEGDPGDIIGVGLCTIRFCRCLLRSDGTLAQPAMSWMDARVSRPYVHDNPYVRYVTTSSGYITHRFTGEFKDTAANYLGVWPLDTNTWQWYEDASRFGAYNVPRDMLFTLQMPGTILGYVTDAASRATGIPAGLPVVATANDKAVEALGVGCTNEHTAVISLGTYIAAMVQGNHNVEQPLQFWVNLASMPNVYLYESNGIRRGMWMLSWFIDILGDSFIAHAKAMGLSPEELLNQEASAVPAGCDGLMTVPDWLAPTNQPHRKGFMMGFDARHTRAHIYRSILEAIALTMKNNINAMCDELNMVLDKVIISGGGASSDLFMQIFADVLNLPVTRTLVSGAAGLGSAICVAVAVGAYDSFEAAVDSMVKAGDLFTPNADTVKLYDRINNEVYKTLPQCADEVLKKTYPIFG